MQNVPSVKGLGIAALAMKLARSRATIRRLGLRDPTFPRPVYIANRRTWFEPEVDAWLAQRRRPTRLAPPPPKGHKSAA